MYITSFYWLKINVGILRCFRFLMACLCWVLGGLMILDELLSFCVEAAQFLCWSCTVFVLKLPSLKLKFLFFRSFLLNFQLMLLSFSRSIFDQICPNSSFKNFTKNLNFTHQTHLPKSTFNAQQCPIHLSTKNFIPSLMQTQDPFKSFQ